jgi:hypothetical protein
VGRATERGAEREVRDHQYHAGGQAMKISELQGEIRSRDICPWCYVPVKQDATGGMAPFLLCIAAKEVWWHKGCVADNYRTELESQRP